MIAKRMKPKERLSSLSVYKLLCPLYYTKVHTKFFTYVSFLNSEKIFHVKVLVKPRNMPIISLECMLQPRIMYNYVHNPVQVFNNHTKFALDWTRNYTIQTHTFNLSCFMPL